MVILLTDGQSRNLTATAAAAEALKRSGARLLAVGVGSGVDLGELHAIASAPSHQHVMRVSDFSTLQNTKQLLALKTCENYSTEEESNSNIQGSLLEASSADSNLDRKQTKRK